MAELNAIEEDETESESSDNGSEIVKIQLTKRYVEDQNKILSKENDKEKYISKPSQLSPSVPSFKPSNLPTTKETGQTIKHVKQEDFVDVNNNFAKFLLKKDLLSSRFHNFDDCPENYVSWKDTFKCVVHEIGATATEELDLCYSIQHLRKDCHENIKCSECKGTSHTTAMHVFKIGSQDGKKSKPEASVSNYGEEKSQKRKLILNALKFAKAA
ncbi:unnamed protein product [Mytilus edulis]|uniref:Uncharacterized protein n=1 Tax=Mytilus edulis TaxID=6550 RepID=A0A8S3VGX0_MYTED|nr:unnamed protein product [Mytilus edulis]